MLTGRLNRLPLLCHYSLACGPFTFSMAAPDSSIAYLVEMMDPHLVTLQKVDVTAFLANAVTTVLAHFESFAEPVTVQVSIDKASGDLAGILFFTEEDEVIGVIRPYYLARDELECANPEVLAAAEGPLAKLEGQLTHLFKKR